MAGLGNLRPMARAVGTRAPWLMDPYLFLLHPKREMVVWGDYAKTRREAKFIREHYPQSGADRRVLVMLLTGWVYEIKLKLMLATGLRLGGWEPVVLLPSAHHARRALRYSRAFGLQNFVYLSDFGISSAEASRARELSRTLLAGQLSFKDIKNWTFGEAWIGPQILSTIARHLHESRLDLASPTARELLSAVVPEVLGNVMRARRIVEEVNPDLAITNEANYSTYGPFVDVIVARGTSVIQFVQPRRDDALIFKRLNRDTRRRHPASVEPTTLAANLHSSWTKKHDDALWNEFRDRYSGRWFLQNRNTQISVGLKQDAIARRPRRKLAVIFPHVLWDGNLFYGEDLYNDYGDWFVNTIRTAMTNTNLDWIVKIHPANLWKRAREGLHSLYAEETLVSEFAATLPDHIRIIRPEESVSAHYLFQLADFGITVRGTVGVEMPCFGKPVLTAGTGRYSGLGFTVDSSTRREYEEHLRQLHTYPPLTTAQTVLARRHALIALRNRHWTMTSFRPTFFQPRSRAHELDHNLRVMAKSIHEIGVNADLDRWQLWASDETQIDYIER